MTVELVQNAPGQGPFVWPDPPEDLTPYVAPSTISKIFISFVSFPCPNLSLTFPPSLSKTYSSSFQTNLPAHGARHRWDKAIWEKAKDAQEKERDRRGPEALHQPKEDVESIAEQARRLRAGKDKWRPGWMDYGIGILGREGLKGGEDELASGQ